MSVTDAELARVRRLRERLEMDASTDDAVDRERYRWFDAGCSCGLPPGQCRDHPRARQDQRPPAGDWKTWLLLAGRGAGKTRSVCEFIHEMVRTKQARRIALVSPTADDVRAVVVEGESGLLATARPWEKPKYEPSRRRLVWPNGAVATTYSAEEPERLRGPQHDFAVIDELGSWRYPATLDNLLLGLRLGSNPRLAVATTPRNTKLVKDLVKNPTTAVTRATSFDNASNLAPDFLTYMEARFEGTKLGRQELYGELLEIVDGAWFPQFSRDRHVKPVEPIWDRKFYVAIDCGVSRCTGAIFFQAWEEQKYHYRVQVIDDFYAEDSFSADNAMAISHKFAAHLPHGQKFSGVFLDPASNARSGVGTAAFGEYQKVFGQWPTHYWPRHGVTDGLDTIDVMLGSDAREPELAIDPRCEHLISAFNTYCRASVAGEYLNHPKDPQHPAEDLIDALRGGIRAVFPDGRRPRPEDYMARIPARQLF